MTKTEYIDHMAGLAMAAITSADGEPEKIAEQAYNQAAAMWKAKQQANLQGKQDSRNKVGEVSSTLAAEGNSRRLQVTVNWVEAIVQDFLKDIEQNKRR